MPKYDYKKQDKEIYLPKQKPQLINLKKMKYITIDYLGNPNNKEFESVMSALYGLSYTVKMKSKKLDTYYEYVVFPLEGIWTFNDPTIKEFSKDNFKGKLMIRQPDFLDENLFNEYKKSLYSKEKNQYILNAQLEEIEEGSALQILHIGSYDDEPKTFAILNNFLKENNYSRKGLEHKEIYLSNPKRVSSEKLKTVLRIYLNESI